jgi:hypothetical protein
VFVPIDLCGGTKGRLFIQPTGEVVVAAQTAFTDAQCFTSLEGVSFPVPEPAGLAALASGALLVVGLGGVRARRARR